MFTSGRKLSRPSPGHFLRIPEDLLIATFGLIKFDFLGLDALTIIDKILERIDLRLSQIPKEDFETFLYLQNHSTWGLFQISNVNSEILKLIKVSSINDIADVIGLNRPGSMDYIDEFIKRRTGEIYYQHNLEDEHPVVQEILQPTYVIFIWQEQIMQLAIKLAGYTGAEADHLRKIIGKKIFDLMPQQKEKFILGASKKVSVQKAEKLYGIIENFKGDGFNKSHGVAYAFNTYYMSYLKCHHTALYYWAWLNQESIRFKRAQIIQIAYSEGIEILPPHVLFSEKDFTVEGSKIRFGLSALTYFSVQTVEKILKVRKNKCSNLSEFLNKVNFSSSELTKIKAFFEEDFTITLNPEVQYKFLEFIWSDLKVSRYNCLRYWKYNHVLENEFYPKFKVRILEWGNVRDINNRDNLRVRPTHDKFSYLIFSDGTLTLRLLVNDLNVINFINKNLKRFDQCYLTLNFQKSVKKLTIVNVEV